MAAAVQGSGRIQTNSQTEVLDSKNLRIKVRSHYVDLTWLFGDPELQTLTYTVGFHLQLVLLGDSGVGKSCIVLRFVRGQFDASSKVRLHLYTG